MGTHRNVKHLSSTAATSPGGHTGSGARQLTERRSQLVPSSHRPRNANAPGGHELEPKNVVPSQPQYATTSSVQPSNVSQVHPPPQLVPSGRQAPPHGRAAVQTSSLPSLVAPSPTAPSPVETSSMAPSCVGVPPSVAPSRVPPSVPVEPSAPPSGTVLASAPASARPTASGAAVSSFSPQPALAAASTTPRVETSRRRRASERVFTTHAQAKRSRSTLHL
jgi:hypothetical protein